MTQQSTYIDSLGNINTSQNDFSVFTMNNIRSFTANTDRLLMVLNTINHKFDTIVLIVRLVLP